MTKRVMITLDEDQYEILQGIKGLGQKDAEKIRNIITAYFSEKNYIKHASTGSMDNVERYRYERYTWTNKIDVREEAQKLSKDFEIEEIQMPEPNETDISIYRDSRQETIIKADTLSAIIGSYMAILYQKNKAPFTTLDLLLRQKILELYPRTTPTPLPLLPSFEPKFVIKNTD